MRPGQLWGGLFHHRHQCLGRYPLTGVPGGLPSLQGTQVRRGRAPHTGWWGRGARPSISGPQFPSLFREEPRSRGPWAVSWSLPPSNQPLCSREAEAQRGVGFRMVWGREGGRSQHRGARQGHAGGDLREEAEVWAALPAWRRPPSPARMRTPRSVHPCQVPRHVCPPPHHIPTHTCATSHLVCCVSASPAPHPVPTLTHQRMPRSHGIPTHAGHRATLSCTPAPLCARDLAACGAGAAFLLQESHFHPHSSSRTRSRRF